MADNVIQALVEKARQNPSRIIFPESAEEKVLEAASLAAERGIARPVLVGTPEDVRAHAEKLGISLAGVDVVGLPSPEQAAQLAHDYVESGGRLLREGICAKRMGNPLFYAAMLVRTGAVDAMVAGLTYSTADVIFAAKAVVGMREGISTPSSIFLMEVPGFQGSEGDQIVFADCGVCVAPGPAEVADIAIIRRIIYVYYL